jgi:23S rRNA (cytosine1962-C5)-methyltransferase
MFIPDQYELLDFGGGRRLERFGDVTLDRPCPLAEHVRPADPAAWEKADARFDRTDADEGTWTFRRELPRRWTIAHGPLVLEVRPTAFGQVGLFPEQAENWDWIAGELSQSRAPCEAGAPCRAGSGEHGTGPSARRFRVLNLFAYTGASTLAAAAAGAEVTHVDAARNMVAWARRNAASSGLAGATVRWLVEDAAKFVRRELRRGNRYDAVILDPPSYGHGPHGEVWRLSQHLARLLELCGRLTGPERQFMLLTCHTPGFSALRLRELLVEALGQSGRITAGPLVLRTADGRELPSGAMLRWERERPCRSLPACTTPV